MPVQFEKWFRVDLNKKAMTEWIGNGLFTNDNLSNLIGVELYDGLTPIDIPGNVEGILILPNGGTLTINGSHEGNRAWIELPETALSLEGLIVITIKTIINDRKVTLVQCSGRVVATETGLVIDPDDIVPKDVTEFMAMLDDLRDLIDGYSDIIMVQDTQPDSETNKLWLLKTPDTGIQIPTMDDLNSVSSDISSLAEDVADIQSDLADAIESIETLETTTEGLSDSVADLEEEVANKADIDGYYTDMTVGAAEQVVSSTMVEDNAPYKLRTSGGSTDIGNRAYVDKVVGGTVAWNQQVRDAASENVTEYADVVTVTDAVEDDAAVSVRVEPVQDLHGYDAPWPAGGGANKFDALTWVTLGTNSNFYSVSADETITVLQNDASGISNRLLDVDAGEQYSFLSTFVQSIRIFSSDSQTIAQTSNGTFTAPSDGKIAVKFYASAYPTSGQFILVKGSTVPSAWSPYSNICPISGWNQVEITRSGANLLPTYTDSFERDGLTYTVASDGSVTVNGTATQTTTYYASASTWEWDGVQDVWLSGCPTGGNYMNGYSLRVDPTFSGYSAPDIGNGVRLSGYTSLYNLANVPLRFCIVVRANTVCNNLVFRPMLNFGLSALPYTPYTAINTYTIEMPTEAGTVYGGVLTVNKDGSGSLAVNKVSIDLGTKSWSKQSEAGFHTFYTTSIIANAKISAILCSQYKYNSTNSHASLAENELCWFNTVDKQITVRDTVYADATAFRTAMNGVQAVYELAELQTYTLTATQVQTLLGTNHVWSDAGQLSLTYTGTDEYLVLTTGRKYLSRINGTDSMVLGAGQEVTAVKGRDNVFDLTQMLGTSVADYVYQQGASYFRKWFGGTRYAYNAGELISVEGLQSRDVVGFNQWDEEWELGMYDVYGNKQASTTTIRSKNFIPILPSTQYYFMIPSPTTNRMGICWYDQDKNLVYRSSANVANGQLQSISNAHFITFYMDSAYGATYNHDICINLSHNASRNGSYEPYTRRSYPLDSTLTLRGIPKVYSNGVYWDGDEYGYDGAVKRRYGVVDLGTLNWSYISSPNRFSANFALAKWNSTNTVPSAMCIMYNVGSFSSSISNPSEKNIFFWGATSSTASTNVNVIDSEYSDAVSFKAAMSGVYLIYELATSTAETAQPYQHIQHVDDWGTEEFVSGTITPVGHKSRYPQNLRDKLQHLPALASSNGSYIITQTDGQMVLSPFPTPPTAAGNYLLKATVSGGNATYSWVAQ